ncbi:radical SAM protein, partial [Candidatus Aminicenantes bacterium AH-873-B07]|nr:radical SAM protein [Candidatus Aminicenantes bacterium AH-873-B07]
MAKCINCGQESILISKFLSLCAKCIKEKFDIVLPQIKKNHAISHERFGLPAEPPKNPEGIKCDFCINECIIGEGEKGYCGLRKNEGGKFKAPSSKNGNLSWYYDSLPTNCVGDWVCPGGTGAGYPKFSYSLGPEYGYKNLAVFYHGCSFNCLFCQNWHFREYIESEKRYSALELAQAVDSRTSCICYFGGDPTPQLSHAIKASRLALKMNKRRILRICWETNGSMN